MKNEQVENTVLTLHRQGWSIRRISRELGISRGRIRRLLAANADQREASVGQVVKPRSERKSKLDPYKALIGQLLEKYNLACEINANKRKLFHRLNHRSAGL